MNITNYKNMRFKNTPVIVGFLISLVFFMQGCNKTWDDHYNTLDRTTEKDKIISEMEKIPDISKFTEAVKQLDTLADLLGQNRLYTVFAPANETFDSVYNIYSGNKELLSNFIMYHFINGRFMYRDMSSGEISTFSNKYITININSSDKVLINNRSSITYPDNLSLNGIIQVIDKPLVPVNNLYEFFRYNQDYQQFEGVIINYTEKFFNMDASTPASINEDGDVVFDSVFNVYNPFLYKMSEYKAEKLYGVNHIYVDIDNEDQKFTAVIPSNFNEVVNTIQENPVLNGEISAKDIAGPILFNFVINNVYSKDSIVSLIKAYKENPNIDTTFFMYFAGLLENNFKESITLSNGLVHIVDDLEYDLSWLITDQVNWDQEIYKKEADYRNNIFASATFSENIDTAFVTLNNIKTVFYESTTDINYASRFNEWVNFELNGDFYPVNYKIFVRGKNTDSGIFQIEADGKDIGQFNFAAAPSGDLDTKFNLIGTVGFTQRKTTTNLKFVFKDTHPGANKGNQYLWIREIVFVPILD